MNTEQIKNAVEKYHNYIVEMRREFHRYPEVSGKEQHTSVLPLGVCAELAFLFQ